MKLTIDQTKDGIRITDDNWNEALLQKGKLAEITGDQTELARALQEVLPEILQVFNLEAPAVKPEKPKFKGKPRHRWSKEIAEIPFYVNHNGAKAEIYWQKRNEMLIKKGATLMADPPLNKDGSLGFAAKFTLGLRRDHADSLKGNKTTQDIVLKSVNEVGNFLYFAGTNSWLVLKDKDGKTINEYTVIAE